MNKSINKFLDYKNIQFYQGLIFFISTLIIGYIITGNMSLYVIIPSLLMFAIPMKDERLLKVLFIVIILQNFTLIMLSDIIGSRGNTFLSGIKELVMVYTVIYIYIFYKKKRITTLFKKTDINNKDLVIGLIMIYSIYVFTNIIVFNVSLGEGVHSIRQLFVPILSFIFGKSLLIESEQKIENTGKFIICVSLIVAILGIIEIIVLNDVFWENLGIYQYAINKGAQDWFYDNSVSINWYTYDLISIIPYPLRRLVSIMAEPLAVGHLLVFAFLMLLYCKDLIKENRLRIGTIAITGIAMMLTLSKGTVIIFLIGISALLFIKSKNKKYPVIFLTTISSLGLITLVWSVYKTISTGVRNSIYNHFEGFLATFHNFSIFGNGIGKVGNFAAIYNADEVVGAGESFIGSLVGQIGIVGLILFASIFIYIFYSIYTNRTKIKNANLILFTCVIVSATLVESFLAESAISILGTGIYFIFLGIIQEFLTIKGRGVNIED